MARRNRHTTKAERQLQLLWKGLLFLAVVAIVFFFTLNRMRTSEEADLSSAEVAQQSAALAQSAESSSFTAQDTQGKEAEEGAAEETFHAENTPAPESTTVPVQEEKEASERAEEAIRKAKEKQTLMDMEIEDAASVLRNKQVPEDLVVFMEEYPESKEFVIDYLYRPEKAPSKDISEEVQKGRIPHFLQWDERWGYDYYDDSYFAVAGCGPTALSEVYCGLTGDTSMNPYEMGVWATEMGYHVRGQGTSWEMMGTGAEILGLNVWGIGINADAILGTLWEGYPIIAAVSPGDFTHFGHFIVLAEADDEGNITVRDSNSLVRTQRTWTCEELTWQIAGLWAYSYDG